MKFTVQELQMILRCLRVTKQVIAQQTIGGANILSQEMLDITLLMERIEEELLQE